SFAITNAAMARSTPGGVRHVRRSTIGTHSLGSVVSIGWGSRDRGARSTRERGAPSRGGSDGERGAGGALDAGYVRGVAIVRGLVVARDERDEMARPGGCSERCGPRHSSGVVGPSRVLGRVALG